MCESVFLVREGSILLPADQGMKGLAFALDPDGYWIEIDACPSNSDLQEIKFWMISSQVGAFLFWGVP